MLRLRVASAAVLIPVVLVVFAVGQPWLTLLIALVTALAGWEAAALLRQAGFRAARLLVPAIALGFVAVAWWTPSEERLWMLAIGVALIVPAFAGLARPEPREGFQAWMATAFGGVYAGLLAFLVAISLHGPPLGSDPPIGNALDPGRAWLLALVLTVWSFDTLAYVVGRAYGRRPFLAHISPSKTWTGVVGGTVGAIGVAALCLWAFGRNPALGLVLGLLIAVAAQVGDVSESMLKRAAGAKDSGRLIPGHGGVLDRVDSIVFAAPAMYLFLILFSPFL
ncbi:MAG: phosphatidate cytidylyltransferase [Chloroflexi bacterium]|nr:phosphatidate cytidylyltransferase [Chloroflexota bacterium]